MSDFPSQGTADEAITAHRIRVQHWRDQGLSIRAAKVLAITGVDTVEQLAALNRRYFKRQPNCGVTTLKELERLGNWRSRMSTPVDVITASLALTFPDPEEAREVAVDILIGLRRQNFMITPEATQRHIDK